MVQCWYLRLQQRGAWLDLQRSQRHARMGVEEMLRLFNGAGQCDAKVVYVTARSTWR
ncbi:hypothetical protein E2542_SST08071 [Spatholobus suberectus]|nr:hypothetical protein E2542_SST08071 [Spatholobus suberectus]